MLTQDEKKLRYSMFIDSDGCMFGETYSISTLKCVLQHNSSLISYIQSLAPQFHQMEIGNFSLAQSFIHDFHLSFINKTGCRFLALQQLAEHLHIELNKFLIADIFADLPAGTSFKNILEGYWSHEHHSSIQDESKLTIAYPLIHNKAMTFPDDEHVIDFVDDLKNEILLPLLKLFKSYPELIPKTVTVRFFQYSGRYVAFLGQVKGTGEIDKHYRQTTVDMVAMSGIHLYLMSPEDGLTRQFYDCHFWFKNELSYITWEGDVIRSITIENKENFNMLLRNASYDHLHIAKLYLQMTSNKFTAWLNMNEPLDQKYFRRRCIEGFSPQALKQYQSRFIRVMPNYSLFTHKTANLIEELENANIDERTEYYKRSVNSIDLLFKAITYNHLASAQLLLHHDKTLKYKTGREGSSALLFAVKNCRHSIIAQIINEMRHAEHGFNSLNEEDKKRVMVNFYSTLNFARLTDSPEELLLLLKGDFIPLELNENYQILEVFLFLFAAEHGLLITLGRMLKRNSSLLNKTDSFNCSAVMVAAIHGQKNIMKYLIENKAELNLTVVAPSNMKFGEIRKHNYTTFDLASANYWNDLSIMQMLIKAGALSNCYKRKFLAIQGMMVRGEDDQIGYSSELPIEPFTLPSYNGDTPPPPPEETIDSDDKENQRPFESNHNNADDEHLQQLNIQQNTTGDESRATTENSNAKNTKCLTELMESLSVDQETKVLSGILAFQTLFRHKRKVGEENTDSLNHSAFDHRIT